MADQTLGTRADLLADIEALPDDELLALAYSFSQSDARLRLYLQLFRARTGERAQLAACLLCFDLAQRGDAAMAAQFGFLRGTLQALARVEAMVSRLTGGHAYLCQVWAQCAAMLGDAHDAVSHEAPGVAEAWGFLRADDTPIAGAFALLDDSDLPAASLEVDVAQMWAIYVAGCTAFFGSGGATPSYDGSLGFRLGGVHGQARAQTFLNALDQCVEFVPPARGMRPLLLLAWGLSLRGRGLLGQINRRRQHLLAAGIVAFAQAQGTSASVAGALGPLYSDAGTWSRIAEFLLHNVQWSQNAPQHDSKNQAHAEAYVEAHMPR